MDPDCGPKSGELMQYAGLKSLKIQIGRTLKIQTACASQKAQYSNRHLGCLLKSGVQVGAGAS